jgi:hypothetical protein
MNKLHRSAIGLTRDGLVVTAWPETAPASGGAAASARNPARADAMSGNRDAMSGD